MKDDQLQAAPGKILHFPTVLGAVVPIYNLPQVSEQLKFTGPLLAVAPALAHPPRQPDSAEQLSIIEEVKVFRDKVAKAVTDKDFPTLRSIYADAFTHTHGSGKLDNKDARIVSAMAGEPLIENAPARELSYRVFAGPTVVVTGKSPDRQRRQFASAKRTQLPGCHPGTAVL